METRDLMQKRSKHVEMMFVAEVVVFGVMFWPTSAFSQGVEQEQEQK